jgi:transporter family-2 protein
MNYGFLLLTILAGGLIPVQAGINATMGKTLQSPGWSTAINFAAGLVCSTIIAFFFSAPGPVFQRAGNAPWWAWTGGAVGAIFVCWSLMAVEKLGFVGLIAGLLAGQLIAGVIMDQFGAFGNEKRPIDVYRIAGVIMLLAGFVLVQYGGRK